MAALEIAERGRARALVELLSKDLGGQSAEQKISTLPSLEQIQQIAYEHNATLVEYSILWSRTLLIWVIKPSGKIAFRLVELSKELNRSLEDLVIETRRLIGARGRHSQPAGGVKTDSRQLQQVLQLLYGVLIQPIAELLPENLNERVIFIPQDSLFLVPFPALQDASGNYLIQKHTILTAPSINVLKLTHQHQQRVQGVENVKDVLVVGNPTMPLPIDGQEELLKPLPGAEKEAKAIASLLKTKVLTSNDATKAVVVTQMPKARIIHLATHGLLDDAEEIKVPGAIALAPSGNDNGWLKATEIMDLYQLNAELVVLSACDTGQGRLTGDGVIGLSRSFIAKGVPSVVVSLWSIPDAPTASFMVEFYQNLQKGLDKALALRQAMLTMIENRHNPLDWAAFTLIGEADSKLQSI